jgi:hypothetical protein
MRTKIFVPALILALSQLASARPDDDTLADEVLKAKNEHFTSVSKAKSALLDNFDSVEKMVRKDNRIKAEDQVMMLKVLMEEREQFETKGVLPNHPRMKTAVMEYKKAVEKADKELGPIYDKAIKQYTKEGKDLKAEALVIERREVLTLTPAEKFFEVGMVWEGKNQWNKMDYPAKLVVTSRTKDKFTGTLTWSLNQDVEVKVEGRVTELAVVFVITKVTKGANILPATYEGKIEGPNVIGSFGYKGPLGETKGDFKYSYVKPKGR